MTEMEGKVKKWGNSFGLLIPNEIVKRERLRDGQKVNFIILKKYDVLKKTFGTLKLKKSSQKIKDDLRRELYDR